jgi:ParB family transcriptional regulator, chromosome partitioning protein
LISQSSVNTTAVEELFPIDDTHTQSMLIHMVRNEHLSTRRVRKLVKAIGSKKNEMDYFYDNTSSSEYTRICKSFDKLIIALRMAIKKLAAIIEKVEDKWLVYDIIMQHKHMLNQQVDLLIKQKIKYKKNIWPFIKLD